MKKTHWFQRDEPWLIIALGKTLPNYEKWKKKFDYQPILSSRGLFLTFFENVVFSEIPRYQICAKSDSFAKKSYKIFLHESSKKWFWDIDWKIAISEGESSLIHFLLCALPTPPHFLASKFCTFCFLISSRIHFLIYFWKNITLNSLSEKMQKYNPEIHFAADFDPPLLIFL